MTELDDLSPVEFAWLVEIRLLYGGPGLVDAFRRFQQLCLRYSVMGSEVAALFRPLTKEEETEIQRRRREGYFNRWAQARVGLVVTT